MTGLNKTFFSVQVAETDKGRAYFAQQEWADPDTRIADIIIVPWEAFRPEMDIVFPQGTSDLFKALGRSGIGQVAIAARPENYQEIALHGKIRRWPTIVVSAILLPALAGFLGDLAHDAVPQGSGPDTVKLELVVEGDMGRCISIKYEGPSDRLADTLIEEAARCLPAQSAEGAPDKK